MPQFKISHNNRVINLAFLQDNNVSKRLCDFFERNFPNGINFSFIKKIEGDCEHLFVTIYDILLSHYEYDKKEKNVLLKFSQCGDISYLNDNNTIDRIDYSNGKYFDIYRYDNEGKLKSIWKYENNIIKGNTLVKSLIVEHNYSENRCDIIEYRKEKEFKYVLKFNNNGNIKEKILSTGEIIFYKYEHDERGNVVKIIPSNGKYIFDYDVKIYNYKYDKFGRLIEFPSGRIEYI